MTFPAGSSPPGGSATASLRDQWREDSLLFAANPMPMWVFDPETLRFLQVNDAAVAQYGFSRDEFLGMTLADIRPPEDVPALSAHVKHLAAAMGLRGAGYWRHRRKDGTLLNVQITSQDVLFKDRRARLVVAQDVSERERLAAQVHAFFESDLMGLIFADVHGGVLDANEKLLRMLGYTRDDLRSGRLSWAEITPPEFRAMDEAGIAEARGRGACVPYEKQLVRKDGTRLWVLLGYALLEPERERGWGFVLDIDARKQAEDELRNSEQRFAKVFQSSLIAIGIAEISSGRVVDVNNRCTEFFGYRREEMVGRTVFELGLWADPSERAHVAAGISVGRPSPSVEAAFRHKSGEIRHALVSMEAMTLAGIAEPLNFTAFVDVTERRRLESQLLQAQKMEAVGRLAGGVAHDFNNSLGVILGYTELLMREAGEAQRGKLDQILKAAHHASGLTRQLLAFSRKEIANPKVLDLNALLSHMEEMLGRLIGESIDLAILPGVDLGTVKADPGQLEQVVMNLCVNARDAMPDGGLLRLETANAEMDAAKGFLHEPMAPGRYVMLAVSDIGGGMDKDVLSKIFEPFFTTKETGKGTGLGLSMVYGIVKQAGGSVWAYSEVGQGTTIKVYLPRTDEPIWEAGARDAPMPSRGWETILLVEDEDSLRKLAREILEEHGYDVLEAGSPTEAIEIAARRPDAIHLLVTDVVMPGMNGGALAACLVATRPALRVLYMSGYTDDVVAHHGVLDSGTRLLEKPFTALGLLGRVREALGTTPTEAVP